MTKGFIRDSRSPIPLGLHTSKVMSANKGKNTKPELMLRRGLWENGVRGYRLHPKNIPGKPDIAFVGKKVAIFVNGCFWHFHQNCKDGHFPKNNSSYWKNKIERNVKRDKKNIKLLERKGWRVISIWECDIKRSLNTQVNSIKTSSRRDIKLLKMGLGVRKT